MTLFAEILSRTPSGLLYHYTSQAGLLGIAASKTIWATKIQYLNDALEFKYAFTMLEHSMDRAAKGNPGLRKLYKAARMALRTSANINIFTGSFSEDGDLLSQWRAYCPPSGGYSLGFRHADLLPALRAQDFYLAPCIYDPQKQRELVEEWRESLPSDEEHPNVWPRMYEFMQVASILKHPSFAEEREWRIFSRTRVYTDPQVGFREGKSMLTPYFRFRLADEASELPLRRIYIGPTPHREAAYAAVTGLLVQSGIYTDMVRHSEAPFRAW